MGDAVRVNDDGPVLSAPTIRYELAEKTKAIAHGGMGAIHRLVQRMIICRSHRLWKSEAVALGNPKIGFPHPTGPVDVSHFLHIILHTSTL